MSLTHRRWPTYRLWLTHWPTDGNFGEWILGVRGLNQKWKKTVLLFLSWRTDGQKMARFHRETKKKKQCLWQTGRQMDRQTESTTQNNRLLGCAEINTRCLRTPVFTPFRDAFSTEDFYTNFRIKSLDGWGPNWQPPRLPSMATLINASDFSETSTLSS